LNAPAAKSRVDDFQQRRTFNSDKKIQLSSYAPDLPIEVYMRRNPTLPRQRLAPLLLALLLLAAAGCNRYGDLDDFGEEKTGATPTASLAGLGGSSTVQSIAAQRGLSPDHDVAPL
jgi:hypothetical protein